MRLSQLFSGVAISELLDARGEPLPLLALPALDIEIAEICEDSRVVQPGDLFVAVPGHSLDGHRFLGEAVRRGAAALLVEHPVEAVAVPVLRVESAAVALAGLSATRYRRPAEELILVGITGTNGKTTTSFLVESVLQKGGFLPGLLGTLVYRHEGRSTTAPLTTPGAPMLHRTLREMRDAGVVAVAMEVSSHALFQKRLFGLRFRVAAFTNLTQDHLDFHGDMERYFEAKAQLFSEHLLPESQGGVGVVDIDGPHGKRMAQRVAPARLLTVSTEGAADISVVREQLSVEGIRAILRTPVGKVELRSPLIGRFNLQNLAVAAGIGVALDLSAEVIGAGLSALPGVPGRVEAAEVPRPGTPAVFVDYAHTPDALLRVMAALRALFPREVSGRGRLIVVFGCGGDRDRGKRPLMGQAVARDADLAIVTSDNPRTEAPEAIIEMILSGLCRVEADALKEQKGPLAPPPRLSRAELAAAERGYFVEPDRRLAIRAAVLAARPEDIVLVAGKGHEDYQILGTGKQHFDDRKEVREALRVRETGEGAAGRSPSGERTLERGPSSAGSSIELSVERVLQATGGQLVRGGPRKFSAVVIDGRAASPGALFVAVRGARHDGHAFVPQAVELGISGVLVERGRGADLPGLLPDTVVIEVADPVVALGQISRSHRVAREIDRTLSVIGITGSSGKTTTKEMMAAILEAHAPGAVLKTEGNLNNHLGVPLTLLRLRAGHRYAVIEMGMSARGEIAYLTSLVQPDVGLITTVGPVHLSSLGTVDNVALAKGELFSGMADGGAAVYPRGPGNELISAQAVRAGARSGRLRDWPIVEGAESIESIEGAAGVVRVEILSETWEGLSLRLFLPGPGPEVPLDVKLPLLGAHNASNAALAAAAALVLSVSPQAIAEGLSRVRPSKHRAEVREIAGRHIIDDCYNASPASVLAALRTTAALRDLRRETRAVLLLGDMLELGPDERAYHQEIGEAAAKSGAALLVALGPMAAHAAEAAARQGIEAVTVASVDEAARRVARASRPGDIILIKGSRGMQLERVLDLLPAQFDDVPHESPMAQDDGEAPQAPRSPRSPRSIDHQR